jgi:membrane glycosyltransferase
LDPEVNRLLAKAGRARRSLSARTRLDALVEVGATKGPSGLDGAARLALLRDGRALASLHDRLARDPVLAAAWREREPAREAPARRAVPLSEPRVAAAGRS